MWRKDENISKKSKQYLFDKYYRSLRRKLLWKRNVFFKKNYVPSLFTFFEKSALFVNLGFDIYIYIYIYIYIKPFIYDFIN